MKYYSFWSSFMKVCKLKFYNHGLLHIHTYFYCTLLFIVCLLDLVLSRCLAGASLGASLDGCQFFLTKVLKVKKGPFLKIYIYIYLILTVFGKMIQLKSIHFSKSFFIFKFGIIKTGAWQLFPNLICRVPRHPWHPL